MRSRESKCLPFHYSPRRISRDPFLYVITGCTSTTGQPVARSTKSEQPQATLIPQSSNLFKSTEISRDIVYCYQDGIPQKLDFYPSKIKALGTSPLIVYIHGGGWMEGDKQNALYLSTIHLLRNEGFHVAAINYRLAPEFPFPAQIIDARCSIRFLRTMAIEFKINPERIGVFGDSAGGHLASLLGLTEKIREWDSAEFSDTSSNVQAVVDLYGPSDLSRLFEDDGSMIWPKVFQANDRSDPLLKAASPLTYVRPDAPPMLIIHGDRDTLVPIEQSYWLYEALKLKGAPVELLVIKNAGHGFTPTDGIAIEP